jgi:hypothetical protein
MDEADPQPPSAQSPPPEPPGPQAGSAVAAKSAAGVSRRWFLGGGAAVLLGGAAGAILELLARDAVGPPPLPPDALVAAARTERALIADLDATTGGTPDVRRVIVQARDDHAAHLQALTGLLARFRRPSAPSAGPRSRRGEPRTQAQLRTAEQEAATAAAQRADALTGGYAALLASIAACEATHAELLG